MKTKILIAALSSGIAVSTTVAITVPLVIKSKYTKALDNFIDMDGSDNPQLPNRPLNYVAIGDSITAGYNGYKRYAKDSKSPEYLSYADFFASDLKKAGKLKSYKNFAKSGATIDDLEKLVTENPGIAKNISEADLISVSIGSNDLLGPLQILGLPISALLSNGSSVDDITNTTRDNLFLGQKEKYGLPSAVISKKATNQIKVDAINGLRNILKTNSWQGVIDMPSAFFPQIFDLIKRNLAILMRDIHHIAPNARIEFVLPEIPFRGFPKSFLNMPIKSLGDGTKSTLEIFDIFINSLKSATKASYVDVFDTHSAFLDFYNNVGSNSINNLIKYFTKKLPIDIADIKKRVDVDIPNKIKQLNKLITDINTNSNLLQLEKTRLVSLKQKEIDDLTDEKTSLSKKINGINKDENGNVKQLPYSLDAVKDDAVLSSLNSWKGKYKNADEFIDKVLMPNLFDIHPSVQGYTVMGNAMFEKVTGIKDIYTMPMPYVIKSNGSYSDPMPLLEIDQLYPKSSQFEGVPYDPYLANTAVQKIIDGLREVFKDADLHKVDLSKWTKVLDGIIKFI